MTPRRPASCCPLLLGVLLLLGSPGCLNEVANEEGASCNSHGVCAPGLQCVNGVCRAEGEDAGSEGEGEGQGECEPGVQQPCPPDEQHPLCNPGMRRCTPARSWGPCEGAEEPGIEDCDEWDNDCDGETDEPPAGSWWWRDRDQDGYGDPNDSHQQCAAPAGYVDNDQDCDDSRIGDHPGAAEVCDDRDNDCDETSDEDEAGDPLEEPCYDGEPATLGVGTCHEGRHRCTDGQWGECQGAVVPRPERCDGFDDDCDGATDEELFGYLDPQAPATENWVQVCPGRFVMGSPGPECDAGCTCGDGPQQCRDPRCAAGCPGEEWGRNAANEQQEEVRLTHAFAIAATEVTQAQWLRTAVDPIVNPSLIPRNIPELELEAWEPRPVESVNWYEALAWCNNLSRQEGLQPCFDLQGCRMGNDPRRDPARGAALGNDLVCDIERVNGEVKGRVYDCEGYRLPTQAEWEYAARAGTTTAYWSGANTPDVPFDPALNGVAVYGQNYHMEVAARRQSNPWGLYDVHGNVAEWCWDWDDRAWDGPQTRKMTRGGHNGSEPKHVRSAWRSDAVPPGTRWAWLGFRPVRTLHPCEPGARGECGTDEGECRKGTRECLPAGRWGACRGHTPPRPELIDGLDNDCDGDVDEALDGTPLTPDPEECDGWDNDHDGLTDEAEDGTPLRRDCYDGPDGTREVGICHKGTQECRDGQWGACTEQVLPQLEICNGLDDDCDGDTDTEPLDANRPPAEQWALICPGSFVMGTPGPECDPGCTCGDGPGQCRDPRCPGSGCPGAEFGRLGAGRVDEELQHAVTLTVPFYMKSTEVTQAQWLQLRWEGQGVDNPSYHRDGGSGGCNDEPCDQRPVEQVTWYDALAWCNWLSVTEGYPPCYRLDDCAGVPGMGIGGFRCQQADSLYDPVQLCPGYRLPTEAEWEFAARNRTTHAFPGGPMNADHYYCDAVPPLEPPDDHPSRTLEPYAWYCANGDNRTHGVATRAPSPWHLWDLHGNVAEWCWDRHAPYWPPDRHPVPDDWAGPAAGERRVIRGGAYDPGIGHPFQLRAGRRFSRVLPIGLARYLGFRPVRSLLPCTPGETEKCGSDTGECVKGDRTCQINGTWGECVDQVLPEPERCGDDRDNDCDGFIDMGDPSDSRVPPEQRWNLVCPGTFTMGSGDEAHQVTLTHAILVKATEVTQAEWHAGGSLDLPNPSQDQACGWDCPVEQVGWRETLHYANQQSQWTAGLESCYTLPENGTDPVTFRGPDCKGYRLPTEAEWEYLARAGTPWTNWTHNNPATLTREAWYAENSGGAIHPVGQKDPNPWGMYDVLGNVAEWVWDQAGDYPGGPREDPLGPAWVAGANRIERGGSWNSPVDEVRFPARGSAPPDEKTPTRGFRLVRTLGADGR